MFEYFIIFDLLKLVSTSFWGVLDFMYQINLYWPKLTGINIYKFYTNGFFVKVDHNYFNLYKGSILDRDLYLDYLYNKGEDPNLENSKVRFDDNSTSYVDKFEEITVYDKELGPYIEYRKETFVSQDPTSFTDSSNSFVKSSNLRRFISRNKSRLGFSSVRPKRTKKK